MSARILFVTGTDTGVGKTVAGAYLGAEAARQGRVVYVKPVQTGLDPDDERSDAAFVARVAGIATHELLRFRAPLAPAVAAGLEGTSIDLDDLSARTCALARDVDQLIVEGAGGLLVPLTGTRTMADFATVLGADLVVVARPGLGTLNHTALTLEAAARRGLHVARLVLSGWPIDPGPTETTNLEQLKTHGVPIDLIPLYAGLEVDMLQRGSFSV
jgi:dethiobiotin synthase